MQRFVARQAARAGSRTARRGSARTCRSPTRRSPRPAGRAGCARPCRAGCGARCRRAAAPACASVHRAARLQRMAQRRGEVAARQRRGVGAQLVGAAGGHHAAAAHAGARAEIDHMVGASHGLLVVLDDDQCVAAARPVRAARPAAGRCRGDAGRWTARRARSRRPAGWSRAARRGGCAAPRRPTASARRGPAPGSRGPRVRGTAVACGSPPARRARSARRAVVELQADSAPRSSTTGSAVSSAMLRAIEAQVQRQRIQPLAGAVRAALGVPRVLPCATRPPRRCSPRPVPRCAARCRGSRVHQPCEELNDSSRGCGSAKPRPQRGQARRLEKVSLRRRHPAHCTTPRLAASVCSSARAQRAFVARTDLQRSPPAARWCARRSASASGTAAWARTCRRRAAAWRRAPRPSAPGRCRCPCAARSAAPAAAPRGRDAGAAAARRSHPRSAAGWPRRSPGNAARRAARTAAAGSGRSRSASPRCSSGRRGWRAARWPRWAECR